MDSVLAKLMWVVTVACIIGTFANAKRKRWSFIVWIAADVCLVAYNAYTKSYAEATLWLVYIGISVYGYREWGKLEREGTKDDT